MFLYTPFQTDSDANVEGKWDLNCR